VSIVSPLAMTSRRFAFVLPHILHKRLLPNDADNYALVVYDREVITAAAKLVVQYIGLPDTDLHLDVSPKRIEVMMEFLAIALSMPVENCDLMDVARRRYRQWFENSSVFGDLSNQNKYIRWMVSQLSLPFELRNPDDITFLRSKFKPFLMNILDDLKWLVVHRAADFEKQTWLLIFNVLIGICDCLVEQNLLQRFARADCSDLKQSAFSCCIGALFRSGIQDDDVWQRFEEYSKSWSVDLDFMKIWNRQINMLFAKMLLAAYKLPAAEGSGAPVPVNRVAFMFQRLVDFVDLSVIESKPDVLHELKAAVAAMTQATKMVTIPKSTFFLNKFPADSFLRVVGPFLTCGLNRAEGSDQAAAASISTIIQIMSDFEKGRAEEMLNQLLSIVFLLLDTKRPLILSSFLNRANDLFAFNYVSLPTAARTSLEAIPLLNLEKLLPTQDQGTLVECVVSLFISSSEILKGRGDSDQLVQNAFTAVWNLAADPWLRFQLVCYASSLPVLIYERIGDYVGGLCHLIKSGDEKSGANLELLIGLIEFIGVAVVWNAAASERVSRLKLIPTVLSSFTAISPEAMSKCSEYSEVVVAALQMLSNIVEWGDASLLVLPSETLHSIFAFITWLHKSIQFIKRQVLRRRSVAAPQPGSRSDEADDVSKRILILTQTLLNRLTSRLNLHAPSHDFFTRTLDSSRDLSEAYVIKKLGVKDAIVNYYSIGNVLLVSVIETKAEGAPIYLFARGPFGRTVWEANDSCRGDRASPQLSDEIQKGPLPAPQKLVVDPIQTIDAPLNYPEISRAELEAHDDRLRSVFRKDYSQWLDWDQFAFYCPFDHRGGYNRPRIIDFLATTGLLNPSNSKSVQGHVTNSRLQDLIRQFDQLENPQVVPVLVTHVMSTDTSFDVNAERATRMTPLLTHFLRDIGEPVTVSDSAAAAHGIPALRTTLPMFPCYGGLAAVIVPSMCKGQAGVRELAKIRPLIRIIFNETNFEIAAKIPDGPGAVLIVKPSISGLYHVWQARRIPDVLSPFGAKQIMSPRTIAFGMSVLIELSAVSSAPRAIDKERIAVLNELWKDVQVSKEFGLMATQIFTSQPTVE
jgi:hypothetical protein